MGRLFGPFFVFAGIMHFVKTRWYERIMPPYVPRHRELVYASGVAEIAGGVATMHPATRRAGSAWSIATLIAVFPANLQMALEPEKFELVHTLRAKPETLSLVEKPRLAEKHKGGKIWSENDPGDKCLITWILSASPADVDTDSCTAELQR